MDHPAVTTYTTPKINAIVYVPEYTITGLSLTSRELGNEG